MGPRKVAAPRLSRCIGHHSGAPDHHPESTGRSVRRSDHIYAEMGSFWHLSGENYTWLTERPRHL